MALTGVLKGSSGEEPIVIKTISISNYTISGGTVPVSGLSKILAIYAFLNNSPKYNYGGGIDINGTWQKVGFQDRTNGVESVADDGSSFVWVDGTSRTFTFVILGIE